MFTQLLWTIDNIIIPKNLIISVLKSGMFWFKIIFPAESESYIWYNYTG